MTDDVNDGRHVALFTPDITDTSTIKRVRQFQDLGLHPVVFGFRRNRYNRDYQPEWPHVLLGRTRDGNYVQRLLALLASTRMLIANRRRLKQASVFHARNIDQLVLALVVRAILNRRVTVAYEVLDIRDIFVRSGPIPALLRMMERLCLRRVRILILSSPGFYRNYYAALQRYRGEWFLLENKLHPVALQYVRRKQQYRAVAAGRRGGYRWVVGYFGLIRGQATVDLIARAAERLRDEVLFRFRGVLTTVDREQFFAALERNKNMVYEGDYENPRDLGDLYGGVDFAWALDLEHADHNSRWLLPCRFYEAGLFGVPCLAGCGFEIGTRIEDAGIGWALDRPFDDSLVRLFETLTRREYEERRRCILALPASTFVAGDDVAALCTKLTGQSRAMKASTAEQLV